MRTAIATVCLSGTLEDKLEAAAAAGFDGIELFEADLLGSPLHPAEVRDRCDALGLSIDLYQPFRDFEAVPPEALTRNLRRAEAKFDVMEALGAGTVLVCSSVSPEAIDDDALAAAQLAELAERAGRRGLRVAYEALAWGRHVSTFDHAWRIVEAAGHPALGTCLDAFHILSRGSDPAGIEAIPGDRIFFLQLADAPHLGMDVLPWSRHHRCFPGQGAFDVAGLCRHVLAAGYDGPLSLEVFNDVFREADPQRTAVDAMRSLLVLQDELGRRPLPAAPRLGGVAFAELGVDPASGAEAERLLSALGLRHVGPHRSKPVALWAAGDAHLIVNHGDPRPSGLVALAVRSDDPDRSVDRAEALLAPVLARHRGPREADLAAVEAPDGTSLFFAGPDDAWLADFVDLGEGDGALPSVPGLLGIDHVAVSQPFDAFDEAALFHRCVLGLEPGASTELVSPDGLVRSRTVADPSGGVRLVLNVPALGTAEPPALQHVALRCTDALAAAEAMHARGLEPVRIPDNYYDDLAARLELDPALLARLRELRVLYDREGDGELLHFYTGRLGGRVFFEVLERRGGYEGFGAANGPVRMAAQRAPAAAGVR